MGVTLKGVVEDCNWISKRTTTHEKAWRPEQCNVVRIPMWLQWHMHVTEG